MLDIDILSNTYSTFEFRINDTRKFTRLDLYIAEADSNRDILVDQYTEPSNLNDNPVITHDGNGIFKVDINRIQYTTIYYKKISIVAFNLSSFVDKVEAIEFEPVQEEHLLGIVNKLQNDFLVSLKTSGSKCVIFRSDTKEEKCSCWDEVLMQSNDSTCKLCDGSGNKNAEIITIEFSMRRVKTSRSRFFSEKGKDSVSQSVFLTYSRIDFNIGMIFYDKSTDIFFEIKDVNIAHIGGIRTSTSIVCVKVLSNDSRLTPFLSAVRQS